MLLQYAVTENSKIYFRTSLVILETGNIAEIFLHLQVVLGSHKLKQFSSLTGTTVSTTFATVGTTSITSIN